MKSAFIRYVVALAACLALPPLAQAQQPMSASQAQHIYHQHMVPEMQRQNAANAAAARAQPSFQPVYADINLQNSYVAVAVDANRPGSAAMVRGEQAYKVQDAAQQSCRRRGGSSECYVIASTANSCMGFATGRSPGSTREAWGVATATTQEAAGAEAQRRCGLTGGRECKIYLTGCAPGVTVRGQPR